MPLGLRRQRRGGAILGFALWSLAACAGAPEPMAPPARAPEGAPLLAVFPVENLSGRPAPLGDVQRLFAERLRRYGLGVLDDATLERVLTSHRVRYTAGVEPRVTSALAQETGAAGILIPSLEVYDEGNPPRVGLFARLVSTGTTPTIRWIDATGPAGDDSPGILGIGLIDDPRALLARAVESLARSLARHVAAGSRVSPGPWAPKFRPKIVYRAELLDPARSYSVAVVPFFNRSARKYAGEIIALHLIRNLMTFPALEVVEPGIVREQLLRYRIIMSDGISLPQTDTVLDAVDADLVLNGEVLEYQDPLAVLVAPRVDFGVLFIERRARQVVYSSYSYNAGDDGVFFFDVGRVNTAHAMAAQMARAIAARMLLGPPTASLLPGPAGPAARP